VACRARRPQRDLVRFTRQSSGWVVDLRHRARGRGAYVCTDPECHQQRRLKRFFGGQAERVAAGLAEIGAALGWAGESAVAERQREGVS